MSITIQALELSNLVQAGDDELRLDDLELAELVTKVLGFLEMQKPVGACHPSLRTLLQMAYSQLAVYLRQPSELAVVDDRASGIIWAVPNSLTGRIEFRVLDLDETNQIVGSRIYGAEPELAATWLKSMLCATSGSLRFDDLIQIREQLSERIKSRVSGDTMAEQASAFLINSFAALAAKFKAPALQCQLAALSDSDHDWLDAFCTRHPQLGLEPHKVLKTAIEFDQLRTAAMNMVVKLSNDVFNSLNTQSFAVQARSYSGLPASLPTQRTVSSLTHRSTKIVADALYLIETQVKAKLMAATMVNIQMGRVDTEYSARQMIELVLAIAENQIDTRSVFTLDETAIKNLNFAVNEWWRLVMVETLSDNGLLALVTSGKDAGRAREYDGLQKFWYPSPKADTALMVFFVAPPPQPITVPDLNEIVDQIAADLPVRKLRRDLPSRNLTRQAQDIVRALPEKVRKRLGEDARRPPYVVHCATAASDSPDYEDECGTWRTGNHIVSPMLTREQKQPAIEAFGPQEVLQWRNWLAAEFRARNFAYGTRGLYLRRYFLQQCAHYRSVLDSDHQAPPHWYAITALMVRSRAVVPALYHRSGAIDYPSFCFSGGGSRPEWG